MWCFNLLELLFSTSRTCESWPNVQKIRVKVTFTDLLLPPQKHFGTLTLPYYYSNVKLFLFFNSVSSYSSCGGRMVPNLIILLVLQSLCMGKFYLLKTGKFNYLIINTFTTILITVFLREELKIICKILIIRHPLSVKGYIIK